MLFVPQLALFIGLQVHFALGSPVLQVKGQDSSTQEIATVRCVCQNAKNEAQDSISDTVLQFDDLPSSTYESDPTFQNDGGYGYYGYGQFQYLAHAVPSPYQSITWNNFYVMNASSPSADGTTIINPASLDNVALAYANETKHVSSMVLNHTGATSFSLSSCYIACFIDDEGMYEGYSYYGPDDTIASNCTVQFDALLEDGTTSQSIAEYQLGCSTDFLSCKQQPSPMQLASFQDTFENAIQVNITVTNVEEMGSYYGTSSNGVMTSGAHTTLLVIDNCEYAINS